MKAAFFDNFIKFEKTSPINLRCEIKLFNLFIKGNHTIFLQKPLLFMEKRQIILVMSSNKFKQAQTNILRLKK